MRTVSKLGILSVIVLWAAVTPAGAQMAAEDQGIPAGSYDPYTPPACVAGVPFSDVTCSTFYDGWIEQFAANGITSGCGGGNYCPNENVTRAQMAVFIEAAIHGTANWSPGDLGNQNTGLGTYSQTYSATGVDNTGIGYGSLNNNTTGNGNTALGAASLANNNNSYNTAVGFESLTNNTTGSNNTAIGYGADMASANLSDATAIGAGAVVDASYHVRIGNTAVTQIGGQVAWSNLSDIRAKTNVQPLDLGLDFVMALRPVSFTLKQGNGRTDLGFIAQDVETLVGDGYNVLGIGGDAARTLSLRYTDLIAPLVKAVQDQQTEIATRGARLDALEAKVAELEGQQAEVAKLKSQLQALLAEHAKTITQR